MQRVLGEGEEGIARTFEGHEAFAVMMISMTGVELKHHVLVAAMVVDVDDRVLKLVVARETRSLDLVPLARELSHTDTNNMITIIATGGN